MMKLVQHEVFFANTFQHSPIGLGIVAMDGTWLKVNQNLCSLSGYSEEELLCKKIEMLTYPDDIDIDLLDIQRLLEGHIDSYQVEKRYVHKRGNRIWVKLTSSLIRDELGNPLFYMVHIQDLTERNQFEKEIRESDKRYRNLIDFSPVPIAVHHEGKFLYVNRAAVSFVGAKDTEEVIGQSMFKYIDSDWWEYSKQITQQMLNTGHPLEEIELRLVKKNGQKMDVILSATPITYLGKTCIQVSYKDITVRKSMEERLKHTNKRLQGIFDKAGVGIALIDNETKETLEVNTAFQKMLGYTEEELQSLSFIEYSHPEDMEDDHRLYQELVSGQRDFYELEKRYIRKDGTILWGYLTVSLLENSPRYVIGIVQDISQRKLLEEELKISNERIRNILEAAKIGTAVADIECGRFLKTDIVLQQILGYSNEELCGKPFSDFTFPEDIRPNMDLYYELIAGKRESYHMEKRYIRKDGKVIWGNLTVTRLKNNPTSVIAMLEDITERKMIEEKLKLYAKVMETTQQGVMITDHKTSIIWVNEAFTKLTGYQLKEVIGKTSDLLKSGKHDAEFYQKMWKSIKKTGHWRGELWNRNKRQEIYPEQLSISAVRNDHGQINNYVGVFNDISELKKVEMELKKANQRLSELTMLDGLTGIANRRCFDQALTCEWNQMKRYQNPMSLILMDIDYFKLLNDTYGHQVGDECLKKVAELLEKCAKRSSDVVARYGGEEFAVILPDTSSEAAIAIAERIRTNIQDLKIPHSKSIICEYVTVSLGLATLIPDRDATHQDLVNMADTALYLAKKEGRNQTRVFEYKIE